MSVAVNNEMTRAKYTANLFQHQISKALRKGKLIEIIKPSLDGSEEKLIVDPALLVFNADETIRVNGSGWVGPAQLFTNYHIELTESKTTFPQYRLRGTTFEHTIWTLCQVSSVDEVLRLIHNADPTPNKEYTQWVLNMYTRVLKDRTPRTILDLEENQLGGQAYLFFEDLFKIPDCIKFFNKIKHGKALTTEQKDINNYKSINDFVKMVFLSQQESNIEVVNPDVLTTQEIEEIASGRAIVVHQDPDWLIVHTVDKEANNIFGKNTVWCTASRDKFEGMFDRYNKDGKLFTILRNKPGAGSHLRTHPENRMQFHFESNQFRDVLNSSIDVTKFFNENFGIKSYFRKYILDHLLKPNQQMNSIISLLSKFGLVQDLIPILRDKKIKTLDLSSIIGKGDELGLTRLGEIETLEELTFRDCSLTKIPDTIANLKNLKVLRMTGNDITTIPSWINELKSLEVLVLTRNKIKDRFDVSELTKLVELDLSYNKGMMHLPTGMGNLGKLNFLDASFCNIQKVDEEVLLCKSLITFNLANNKGLRDISTAFVQLPRLILLNVDDTAIPTIKVGALVKSKVNQLTTII